MMDAVLAHLRREATRDVPSRLGPLCGQAADGIERQCADIDRLVSERQGWLDEVERLRAELQRIADNHWAHADVRAMASRALEQETP